MSTIDYFYTNAKKHIIPSFFLSHIFYSFSSEKEYTFTHFNRRQGLAFNEVQVSYRDSEGLLWVGSRNGLSCFDGYHFKDYFHRGGDTTSLANNNITSITEAIDGNIIIGTWGGGISIFDKKKREFLNYSLLGLGKSPEDNIIHYVYCDNQYRVWFATLNKHLYYFDIKEKKVHLVTLETKGWHKVIKQLSENHFLFRDQKQLKLFRLANDILRLSTDQHQTQHEKKLVVSKGALYEYSFLNNGRKKVIGFKGIECFLKLDSTIFLGGNYGLLTYDISTRNLTYLDSTVAVKHILHDAEDNLIWVSTKNGLIQLKEKKMLVRRWKKQQLRKNKFKEERIRLEEEKKYSNMRWRLFTDISHEIKTPLTLILSPLEEFLKGKKGQHFDINTAQLVHRNAERLEDLVKQLLDFRKVESNMIKLSVEEGNIVDQLKILKESFQSLADQYSFDFQFTSDMERYTGFYDKDILERIVINLLSNAFKYTPKEGTIILSVQIDTVAQSAIITIADTGIGIEEKEQEHIFERFGGKGEVQTEGAVSTGLGLSLVKELVNLHHGDISVESELNKGSTFSLKLSLSERFYSDLKETVRHTEQSVPKPPQTTPLQEESQTESFTILLAEDNQDIHHYLKNELSQEYEVKAFFNGKDAYQEVESIMPDIILSDIMMPQMTGIALCQQVKDNEKTSHIPVILLTAKGSHDNKIEGLNSGADDYIQKPFRLEEVKARIKNVIQVRQRLQQKFSKEVILEGNSLQADSLDDQFIQKAMSIVEEHYTDTAFGIEVFSQEANYSKSQLYSKIKILTGMSPNEFIRVIRLRKAAHMIKQKSVRLGEVAFLVGFSRQSYFSKCFKDQYGMSPRAYQKSLE